MKKLLFVIVLFCCVFTVFSQKNHPVSWSFEKQIITADSFNLVITAVINAPWHIYPLKESGGSLGLPTQIIFEENSNIELIGEIEAKSADQDSKPNAPYFSKGAIFIQKLKLKSKTASSLNFKIKYMACTNAMCLPPTTKQFTVEFTEKDFKKDN
ncbi:protein-disulfide reductase DsbD domain-containing protein [Flavobacterium ajazii]|uniref:protein-disulfide reductase DsbD domain-containing protein n=1 Tax=Flavobacterium ajazii TaxID=2692318 RepID=UPI0013D70B1A|nr:protein-disulfide reductase DsbD domain-containing protein [Flavobacterium ajazii]